MNLYNIVMLLGLFLFFLAIVLHLYAAWFFKKNEEKYNQFLQMYQMQGLQLDLTTRVASYSGFYANYQKIAFFMNLKKGRAMRFSRNKIVSVKAYDFVQRQPADTTEWMSKALGLYHAAFTVTVIWVFVSALFVYVLN